MKINKVENEILKTTAIYNSFMNDYLPGLEPMAVKLYLYLVYACENMEEIDKIAIANLFDCDISEIDASMVTLQSLGLITYSQEMLMICDLAQKEIDRNYRLKISNRPDDSFALPAEETLCRSKLQKAVSDKFFAGKMPITWYNEIDLWFEKYGFTPEVVFSLFQHCHNNHIMTKAYVAKVAESWGEKFHIKTLKQLDSYLAMYNDYKKLRDTVAKKLKMQRPMNEYEEEVVEKWHYTYQYSFDIIEIALKKSVSSSNPTLAMFDGIITKWYNNGLKTADEIKEYENNRKKSFTVSSASQNNQVSQKKNYEQRTFENEDFENFYK